MKSAITACLLLMSVSANSVGGNSQIEIRSQILENEWKTARVTAYSCGGLKTDAEIRMNCPSLLSGTPKTAMGTEPIPYRTMACDRANLGREFILEGIGRVKCTDTGGAITGAGRFDLYVTNIKEARDWGVQEINYKESHE